MANIFQRIFSMPPPLVRKGDLFFTYILQLHLVEVDSATQKYAQKIEKGYLERLLKTHPQNRIYRVKILKSTKEIKEGDFVFSIESHSSFCYDGVSCKSWIREIDKNPSAWCKSIKL